MPDNINESIFQKYKQPLLFLVFALLILCAFYYMHALIMPFIIGLLMAIAVDPIISRIQRLVKSRNLANTLFLVIVSGMLVLFVFSFAFFINRDFQRLNKSFTTLVAQNQTKIDQSSKEVKVFLASIYDFEKLEREIKTKADSIEQKAKKSDFSSIDTKSIEEGFTKIKSLFPASKETEKQDSTSWFFMLISSLGYFVLILYQYNYFTSLREKYIVGNVQSKLHEVFTDFNQTFVLYFKLRSKMILIQCLIFAIAFIIMDLPGVIIITFLIAFLSFFPYLHYLALIPLSISCLVVSLENNQSFLLIFGSVVGVFIIVTLIDELIFTPYVMEKHITINPVILVLSLSICTYLFGYLGLVICLPLTRFTLIYIKRYLLKTDQTAPEEA